MSVATTHGDGRTVAFCTLGCKVNQADTDAVAAAFRRAGYQVVDFKRPADVYVINTCTVTNVADRKSRQWIRRAIRSNSDAVVAAMGCYAQTAPGEVSAIPEIDIVVGTHNRGRLVELVGDRLAKRAEPGWNREPWTLTQYIYSVRDFEELAVDHHGDKTRATLKVQDGCNGFCSYCQIPHARGLSRSRRPDDVLRQVEALAEQGYLEVVIAGIDVGEYGAEWPNISLARLLERIHEVPGIRRIRLSSIDPKHVTTDFLETAAALPKFCRHLHIALQSGDDDVLRRMRRRYTCDQFRAAVAEARRLMPDLALSTDIIVGFPGEADDQFRNTVRFAQEMTFSRIHVFPYSARSGTPAAKLPGAVPADVKERRTAELLAVADELSHQYHSRLIGQTVPVLLEAWRGPDRLIEGYTEHYVRVVAEGGPAMGRRMVLAQIGDVDAEAAQGVILAPLDEPFPTPVAV